MADDREIASNSRSTALASWHDGQVTAVTTSVEMPNLLAAERDAAILAGVTTGKITIAAAIILDESGRILLVRKRNTSAFMLPGGKIETGEAHLATLARELREETGCVLQPGATYLCTPLADAANEPGYLVEAHLYHAAVLGEVRPCAEIEAVLWADPSNPGDLNLAPMAREFALPLARTLAPR